MFSSHSSLAHAARSRIQHVFRWAGQGSNLRHPACKAPQYPELAEETRALYKAAADKLLAWAAQGGPRADDLDRGKLVAFAAELRKAPKTVRKKGGKRGERTPTVARRSPATVNRELRSVGTGLTYLRRLGLLPRLTGDDLRDPLRS